MYVYVSKFHPNPALARLFDLLLPLFCLCMQRAPAALILFSGSGKLTEEDVVTFFKPLSPTRILKLIPSSFFILIFPSIAAADAAVKQRSESCLHLLAAGAEQLRSLQAYERMLLQKYLEAEETRLKSNGGASKAEEEEDAMGENEAEEVEMEEGEMAEGMRGEEDTVATAEKKSGKKDGENGEQGEVKEDNAGKKKKSVEKNGKKEEGQRLQKPPEVFWLLGDVEANLDANEKEHFLRQVECWRRYAFHCVSSSVSMYRSAPYSQSHGLFAAEGQASLLSLSQLTVSQNDPGFRGRLQRCGGRRCTPDGTLAQLYGEVPDGI